MTTDEPRVLVVDNFDSLARTFFGARRSTRRKICTKNQLEVGRL